MLLFLTLTASLTVNLILFMSLCVTRSDLDKVEKNFIDLIKMSKEQEEKTIDIMHKSFINYLNTGDNNGK